MDPNETLRLYREARSRALALVVGIADDDTDAIAACDAFVEADEHISNLTEWLASGGFAPKW